MKEKILINVESSLGELDWIVPFVLSDIAKVYQFDIFSRKNIFNDKLIKKYGLDQENIKIINSNQIFSKLDKFIQYDLQKKVKYVKNIPFAKQIVDKIQEKNKIRIVNMLRNYSNYSFIFLDFGLPSSFQLDIFLSINKKAKVVVFPHGVGIQKLTEEYVDDIRDVKVDLWLENTELSTRVQEKYDDVFFASGAPVLSDKYLSNSLYDFSSNNIFIITRNLYDDYGSTRKLALKEYEKILNFCKKNNFKVFVKHHPRDKKISEYRKIQDKFNNITEYDLSLINLETKCIVCLSFYSTSGIYFTARQIPVFDITPYLDCNKKTLPLHYCDDDGKYTHDLISLEIQHKLLSFDILLDKNKIDKYSSLQFNSLKQYFPKNANENIFHKLEELKFEDIK